MYSNSNERGLWELGTMMEQLNDDKDQVDQCLEILLNFDKEKFFEYIKDDKIKDTNTKTNIKNILEWMEAQKVKNQSEQFFILCVVLYRMVKSDLENPLSKEYDQTISTKLRQLKDGLNKDGLNSEYSYFSLKAIDSLVMELSKPDMSEVDIRLFFSALFIVAFLIPGFIMCAKLFQGEDFDIRDSVYSLLGMTVLRVFMMYYRSVLAKVKSDGDSTRGLFGGREFKHPIPLSIMSLPDELPGDASSRQGNTKYLTEAFEVIADADAGVDADEDNSPDVVSYSRKLR